MSGPPPTCRSRREILMPFRGCSWRRPCSGRRYAIAWERGWPHLARLLTVVGLFLVVSWAGLWLVLPFIARAARARPVRAAGAGRFVSAGAVSLAEPRRGAEPARPWHRHPPSPGDHADRYAGDAGSGRPRAVAGAARAHLGLDQAHPRRDAVAAAGDPRSLGAAGAGRGADGGDLCRRRRRARDAHRSGVRLERRAVAGQCPGRCLGDAAGLYRQAADHPVGRQQGSRRVPTRRRVRCRCRRARP